MKRKIIDMSADLEIDGFQFLLESNRVLSMQSQLS